MTSEEILNIISKPWCTTDDLMKLSQFGITYTNKLKKELRIELENQGYLLPKGKLPMCEVVKKLKINIDYLKEMSKGESNEKYRNNK